MYPQRSPAHGYPLSAPRAHISFGMGRKSVTAVALFTGARRDRNDNIPKASPP